MRRHKGTAVNIIRVEIKPRAAGECEMRHSGHGAQIGTQHDAVCIRPEANAAACRVQIQKFHTDVCRFGKRMGDPVITLRIPQQSVDRERRTGNIKENRLRGVRRSYDKVFVDFFNMHL